MKSIELRPAYVWDCDECAYENFATGVVDGMSPDELEELREEHGISEFDEGHWVIMPEIVTCKNCGAQFKTEHYG